MDIFFDIDKTKMIYVAEGNANIVLKLPEHNKILRLPKSEKNTSEKGSLELLSYLQKCQRYALVLMELCGKNHVCVPQPVELSVNQGRLLNDFLSKYRPNYRLENEFKGRYAMLMRDATLGLSGATTYSIEIKPKQGWLFDDGLNEIFNLNDLKMCRYCCMQYLKMRKSQINCRSKYCPMDLFSGNYSRMQKALEALTEEPQNNLRIFKNGELIFGENKQNEAGLQPLYDDVGKSEFYTLITCSLLSSYVENIEKRVETNQSACNNSYSNLPTSCILKNILDLQLLAKKNIIYKLNQTYDAIKSYKALDSLVLKLSPFQLHQMTPEEQYMIGATLLDVSIMITFHGILGKPSTNCEDIKIVNGKSYHAQIKLLDLDPKPDNHFKKYLLQTNEAYSAAKDFLSKSQKASQ